MVIEIDTKGSEKPSNLTENKYIKTPNSIDVYHEI